MIQIEEIEIDHIRGIKHFQRSLNRQSLAIQGPNGSGKSGIVDSIEFALTGKLSRLMGRGTRTLTTKQHGKHVDATEGNVRVKLFVPAQNRSITITRSTKSPTKPKIKPNDKQSRAVVEEIAGHPEIALTRRQIIRFILAESRDRSSELQALLRLEKINFVCEAMKQARNKCDKARTSDKTIANGKAAAVKDHLEIDELTPERILSVVNRHRKVLGFDAIAEISATMASDDKSNRTSGTKHGVVKRTALLDLQSARNALSSDEIKTACDQILAQIKELEEDTGLSLAFQRHHLFSLGLAAIDSDACPLCDTEWDMERLREHVSAKVAQSERAKGVYDAMQSAVEELALLVTRIRQSLRNVIVLAERLQLATALESIKQTDQQLADLQGDLRTPNGIIDSSHRFADGLNLDAIRNSLDLLENTVAELPEQSARDHSHTFLFEAARRLKEYWSAKEQLVKSSAVSELAEATYQTYQQTAESVLNTLYAKVKQEFEQYYRFLNQEDEGDFVSEFNVSENSLEIKAKFYDHGNHPPAAYHSEGHQDAMGLCLYLALMNQVFAGDLRLVILDDVVMSIDSGHRKKLCELLSKEFPDTQFIITTHERTWFKQMQTAKLIGTKSAIQFSGWTVDNGPRMIDVIDSWREIEATLNEEDIPMAAWKLRNYIEYVAAELAENLGAEVVFRSDGGNNGGELFPKACKRFRELLKKSAKAEASWGHSDAQQKAISLEKRIGSVLESINEREGWMINPAVHHNKWEDFTKKDFTGVVVAYRELLDCFTCPDCGTWIDRNSPVNCSEIRCACGKLRFNLTKATAAQQAERAKSKPPVLKLHASS